MTHQDLANAWHIRITFTAIPYSVDNVRVRLVLLVRRLHSDDLIRNCIVQHVHSTQLSRGGGQPYSAYLVDLGIVAHLTARVPEAVHIVASNRVCEHDSPRDRVSSDGRLGRRGKAPPAWMQPSGCYNQFQVHARCSHVVPSTSTHLDGQIAGPVTR